MGVAESQQSQVIRPKWITVAEACRFASVSKPLLYSWINQGLIRSFSRRSRGQIKGKRLISFDSLRSFLQRNSTGGDDMPE